jgi:pimeloyl-ACP methyl ester carboxylesterase
MRLAPDVELATLDQPGVDPPVVLLHGLASTHRWWELVAARLAGRRVVRWDHRGHGLSSAPSSGYSVEVLAEDAAALLDALQLTRCVVVGHSMGAGVALQVAAQRPDLVSGVCCVEGGLPDPQLLFGPTWPTARPVMCIDRRIMPTAEILARWAQGIGLPDDALAAVLANYQPSGQGTRRLRLRLTPQRETELAYSVWSQRPSALLAQISAPVMAVMARPADPTQGARQHRALQRTLDVSGRTVSQTWIGGSHELPLEQPRLVAEAIAGLAQRGSCSER